MPYSRRSGSPPPRTPSPELKHTPLPLFPGSSRARATPKNIRIPPPGLEDDESPALSPARSVLSKRSRSSLKPVASPPSVSLALPTPPITPKSPRVSRKSSSRSLSAAVPYRSPPASPSISSPPPPVPRIPAFMLDVSLRPVIQPVLDSDSVISPITDSVSVVSLVPPAAYHTIFSESDAQTPVTCMQYFAMKNKSAAAV